MARGNSACVTCSTAFWVPYLCMRRTKDNRIGRQGNTPGGPSGSRYGGAVVARRQHPTQTQGPNVGPGVRVVCCRRATKAPP